MTVDLNAKIPNNVNLSDDRKLQRALESWQPDFIDWWMDMGPEGFQQDDIYLRTAVSVEAGGWGGCFTYGTWFNIEGLLAARFAPNSPPIRKAMEFLLSKQQPDGSWGEAFESCVEHRYVQHENGQVVQTAWALLGLMAPGPTKPERSIDEQIAPAIDQGIEFILSQQRSDGGWNREGISGVFNRNCSINYDNYRFIFPLWALARYNQLSQSARPGH